jgi:hypothetical protein
MFRDAVSKVMWLGRTASMVFGLALVLALVFGVASVALSATGGNFLLGKRNVADAVSTLVRQGPGPALSLVVESNQPPMRVNPSASKATNLNADKLDGMEGASLAEPRGYAHVTLGGAVDTTYPSKGVNGIVTVIGPGTNPTNEKNLYCFDLAFTPKTAVGSPHLNNSAVVATATSPNSALNTCPATHRDAAAATYGSSEGNAAPVNFQIVFE